jgi:hypothetical protein
VDRLWGEGSELGEMIPEIRGGIFICYKQDREGGVGGCMEDADCGGWVVFAGIS